MSESNRFIAVMIATASVVMSLTAAFHLTLDRYRVFSAIRGDYSLYYSRIDGGLEQNHNDRFMPMAYLLNGSHEFDRFILGASNVASMDARRWGPDWYKLNYNSATLDDHLHNVEILVSKLEVQEIVLAIDYLSLIEPRGVTNYKNVLYPANAIDWLRFLTRYLFKKIDEKDLRMIRGVDYELVEAEYHYLRVDPLERIDRDHARNPAFFEKGLRRMKGFGYRRFSEVGVDRALDNIARIKRLAEEHGVGFRIYLEPMHYKNVYHLDYEGLLDIKRRLADITDFYDFSAPHNYMINNSFWKELVHYFRGVSDEIARRLRGEETRCPGFGVLITRENARELTQRMLIESKVLIPHLESRDRRFHPDPGLRIGDSASNEDVQEIEQRLLRDCLQYYGSAEGE